MFVAHNFINRRCSYKPKLEFVPSMTTIKRITDGAVIERL